MILVSAVWVIVLAVATEAAPWRNHEVRQSQVCGDKLADMLSLVCSGRGYNFAFKPEGAGARRFRRGIVEECCRKSCTPAMLELYCRADPTEGPTNVQIRKRSDSGVESTELQSGDVTTKSTSSEPEATSYNTQDNKIQHRDAMTNPSMKEGERNYKLIDLLASSEHPTQRHSTKTSVNKSTPNDTTEEELFKKRNIQLLRHHKKHHHHNRRPFHNRRPSTKTKRDKDTLGESTQTFQIGTVKPYFAGRPLASYRSSYVHHAPLS